MKDYMKPDLEYIDFSTESISNTGTLSGTGEDGEGNV